MFPVVPHLVSECLTDIQKETNVSWPLAQKKYLDDKDDNGNNSF